MQQILDRTEEALAQAFEALARNARRQRNLYYATIGLLIAIVLVSAILLAGLAAARHLDDRRSLVGQYVAAISLMLQGEVSFLRRTDLTVRYNRESVARQPANADIVRQIQQTGIAEAPDPGYALLVPAATRTAWGSALPERLAQLQQIATAAITTQQAFELDHRAYIVDVQGEYAIVIPRDHPSPSHSALLAPNLATDIRDRLGAALRQRIGQPVPRRNEQVWLGPTIDPVLGTPVMTVVSAVYSGEFATTLIAAVIPVEEFLAWLHRTTARNDRATLLLLNSAEQLIDTSPLMPREDVDRIVTRARKLPRERFEITRAGVLLVQPLHAGFGTFVYFVPVATLLASLASDLAIIGALALLLIAAIVITARYWDIHLLRRSHAEATRALENETINHVLVSATPIGLCIVRLSDDRVVRSNLLADTLLHLGEPPRLPRHIVSAFPPGPHIVKAERLGATAQLIVPAQPEGALDTAHTADKTGTKGTNGTKGAGNTVEKTAAADEHADRRFLQITYAPVRYRGEDVLFCAVQDVTAQQQLEERLRTAQQTAESIMRARSNFFAAMSHEIRTPLNALLGNLELLARTPGLDAHASRLRALDVAASGLRRIVNDILDFSKIDAGEMKLAMEPFRPLEDLESLALSYCPMVGDRPLRFYPLIAPSLDITVVGDRTRIMQVVNNLLSNAFKFTSSGKVTLSARLTTDAKRRTVLVCQVRDSGIGMPATLVARIFHPFVQAEANTASRYGGTGLGLSICARLCELMGGHITVESVEGVGSAFSMHVPVTLRDEDALAEAKAPPVLPGASVLIVSQESETGGNAEAWLQAYGWRTHLVQSIAAAERFLEVNRPQGVLVSGEYGLAVVSALHGRLPRRADGGRLAIVWVTREGPPQAVHRLPGLFEVGTFHHHGVLAALETAMTSEADEGETGDVGTRDVG
ncbi:ATP-binding protein, partial [Cupriavidus plantarum]